VEAVDQRVLVGVFDLPLDLDLGVGAVFLRPLSLEGDLRDAGALVEGAIVELEAAQRPFGWVPPDELELQLAAGWAGELGT
jgi:hypothetical protein